MCALLSAVDSKLTYLPMLGALVASTILQPAMDNAYACFVVGIALSGIVRIVRLSRGWEKG
jgi:hypothetical protein